MENENVKRDDGPVLTRKMRLWAAAAFAAAFVVLEVGDIWVDDERSADIAELRSNLEATQQHVDPLIDALEPLIAPEDGAETSDEQPEVE